MGHPAFSCPSVWSCGVWYYLTIQLCELFSRPLVPVGKHARWWLKVFTSGVGRVRIVYRHGRENAKADALSWTPVPSAVDEQGDVDVQVDQLRLTDELGSLDVSNF